MLPGVCHLDYPPAESVDVFIEIDLLRKQMALSSIGASGRITEWPLPKMQSVCPCATKGFEGRMMDCRPKSDE